MAELPHPSRSVASGTTTSTTSRRAGRRRTGGATGSSRASASTASRRAASSPTSTRRRSTSGRSKATRCIPGSRGRTCAKGVVTPNQLEDPDRILYPLRRDGERGDGRVGARDVGRGARRHRRPDPQGDPRGPPPRADVPRRPSRRGRLRQPRAAGVGRRRPQQPHQRLLVVGAARAFPLDRRRSAVARLRERADDPAAVVAPRDRATTSIRTRSGSSRASPNGAHADRASIRGCRTRRRRRTSGCRRTRAPKARCSSRSRGSCSTRSCYNREFVRNWVNWRDYLARRTPGPAGDVRGVHRAR